VVGGTAGGSEGGGGKCRDRLLRRFCSCIYLFLLTQGTMLFTGNTAIVSLAWMEKKVSKC
jgi:hypothetical protein